MVLFLRFSAYILSGIAILAATKPFIDSILKEAEMGAIIIVPFYLLAFIGAVAVVGTLIGNKLVNRFVKEESKAAPKGMANIIYFFLFYVGFVLCSSAWEKLWKLLRGY